MIMIRSALFHGAYWFATVVFALACTLLALLPGKRALGFGLWLYGSTIVALLRYVAGVRLEVRGREHLPAEPCVIAAKHQSWGDGFSMLATVEQLGFVAGDHLYKFPLIGRILDKAGAIVLSNGGGEEAKARMAAGVERLRADRRDVLIYPEGHLAAPGEKHRYRKGVFHLYEALERPCVPVATNLGLAWDRQAFRKTPGRVTLEFLEPVPPGLDKEAFMARLEDAIEARTDALVREGLQ